MATLIIFSSNAADWAGLACGGVGLRMTTTEAVAAVGAVWLTDRVMHGRAGRIGAAN
jgi:hypothetical protein